MSTRENFRRIMQFEKPEGIPIFEWAFWNETINRWHTEGLPIGMTVQDYFGLDDFYKGRISIDFGPIPSLVARTIEETDRYRITAYEGEGLRWVTKDLKTSVSFPQFIEFGLKTRRDWEKLRKRLDPYDKRRYPKNWSEEFVEYYETTDQPTHISGDFSLPWFGVNGVFGAIRNLMGLEHILVNFFKDPEWLHEILDFWVDFQIEAMKDMLEAGTKIDWFFLWEDMAYKNGPFVSPKLFREFLLPSYKKITGFLRRYGIDIIAVDSDGNIDGIVPLFLEGGVNCLLPLEVAAGMDGPALRKKYGRQLRMMGNIDKRVVAAGKEAIDRELDSKVPCVEEGGFIPAIDHHVSSDISFQNYGYYNKRLKHTYSLYLQQK